MGPGFSRERFAENVKELRKQAGLSQAALAEAVGVSTETISRIERVAFEASLTTACALAETLGVTMDELLGDASGEGRPAGKRTRSPVVEQLAAHVERLPAGAQRALLKVAQLIPVKS